MTRTVGRSESKIPGGKLIRVECAVEEGKVVEIAITGDFFVHPEDDVQKLERELVGLNAEPEVLKRYILDFFKRGSVIVGDTSDDFAKAILEALPRASLLKTRKKSWKNKR